MSDFLQKLKMVLTKGNRVDYRDRRGHYASGNLGCLRDQYWSWHKEPETNPTDFKGAMKMLIGKGIEDAVVGAAYNQLALFGYFSRGSQIAVGGSNPDWNGYLDGLFAKQNAAGVWEQFVVEIKTKSGYGADLFARNPEPSQEYMTQLGLYLKDLHEKGVTNKGCFLFILLSDNTIGTMITVDVHYDPVSKHAIASTWNSTDGQSGEVSTSVDLEAALERWRKLDKAIAAGEVPAGEYKYKYDLTPEVLAELPDAKLKKIIEGSIVFGDWQPLYSRYKNKALEADGLKPERTQEELEAARQEYRRRHPRSKI